MLSEGRYKNFGIERGDYYAKRDPRPYVVREAARELREWLVAQMYGRRKSRKLGCVQSGDTHPLTAPLELAVELHDARFGFADSYRAVIVPQVKALAALHRVDLRTGDFDPPTPHQQALRKQA